MSLSRFSCLSNNPTPARSLRCLHPVFAIKEAAVGVPAILEDHGCVKRRGDGQQAQCTSTKGNSAGRPVAPGGEFCDKLPTRLSTGIELISTELTVQSTGRRQAGWHNTRGGAKAHGRSFASRLPKIGLSVASGRKLRPFEPKDARVAIPRALPRTCARQQTCA